jgi:hypothetical protein
MSNFKQEKSQWTAGQPVSEVAPLLTPAEHAAFAKQMCAPYTTATSVVLNGTSTGNEPAVYDREYEVEQIVKKHSKGYYYLISVNDTDDVYFMVFNGSKLAYWLHKLTNRVPPNAEKVNAGGCDGNWDIVRKRTHLPATLGAAYQEIDEVVKAHKETYKETLEHDDYIAGLLDTEPENLKMIEGLEKLQEGEPEAESSASSCGYNSTVSFSGISQATGKMFEEKISEAITRSIQDKTDNLMLNLLEDGTKESTGPKAQ